MIYMYNFLHYFSIMKITTITSIPLTIPCVLLKWYIYIHGVYMDTKWVAKSKLLEINDIPYKQIVAIISIISYRWIDHRQTCPLVVTLSET